MLQETYRFPDFYQRTYDPERQRVFIRQLEQALSAVGSEVNQLRMLTVEAIGGDFAAKVHTHTVDEVLGLTENFATKAELAQLKLNDLADVVGAVIPGDYVFRFNGLSYQLVAATLGGGGVSTFTELTDTPASYAGQGQRLARVNAAATGLEFINPTDLSNWSIVTAGLTMLPGLRYAAELAATADFNLPTFSAGQVFVVHNSWASAESALVRVVVGVGRQIVGLPVAENLTCEPRETIVLVARNSTTLDLVTPGAVGPYGNDGLSATDQIESPAAAEFWLADTMPFKVFNYAAGFLDTIELYMDAGLTDHRYTKTFIYTGEQLTSIRLTREADAQEWVKTLSYDIEGTLELIGAEAA